MPEETIEFDPPSTSSHADEVRRKLKQPPAPRDRRRIDGEERFFVEGDERPPAEWEESNSAWAAHNWELGRSRRLDERQREREDLSLPERLSTAIGRIMATEGGMSSRPIAAIRASAEDSPGGSRPPGGGSNEEAEQHLTWIRHHIKGLEAIIDSEDGLMRELPEGDRPGYVGVGGARMFTTAKRDQIVFDDFQGIPAEQVAREAPYLGTSARTIERARKAEAERRKLRVRLVDGTVLGPVPPTRLAA